MGGAKSKEIVDSDGSVYEGEYYSFLGFGGNPSGLGARWNARGDLTHCGRWSAGKFVERRSIPRDLLVVGRHLGWPMKHVRTAGKLKVLLLPDAGYYVGTVDEKWLPHGSGRTYNRDGELQREGEWVWGMESPKAIGWCGIIAILICFLFGKKLWWNSSDFAERVVDVQPTAAMMRQAVVRVAQAVGDVVAPMLQPGGGGDFNLPSSSPIEAIPDGSSVAHSSGSSWKAIFFAILCVLLGFCYLVSREKFAREERERAADGARQGRRAEEERVREARARRDAIAAVEAAEAAAAIARSLPVPSAPPAPSAAASSRRSSAAFSNSAAAASSSSVFVPGAAVAASLAQLPGGRQMPYGIVGPGQRSVPAPVLSPPAAVLGSAKKAVNSLPAISVPAPSAPEEPDNDTSICVVCVDAPRDCLIDCPHFCLCIGCAKRLSACPICRVRITQRIHKKIVLS
jgi:hypothetical protein